MKIYKGIACFVLTVAMLLTVILPAAANGGADFSRKTSLTLSFIDEGRAVAGGAFSVWKIADLTADGTVTPADAFAAASPSFDDQTAGGLSRLALTLSEYAARENIAPQETGTTGADGKLIFQSVNGSGVYLITGKACTVGEYEYRPSPFIVSLPWLSADGAWIFDMESEVKFAKITPDEPMTEPSTVPVTEREPSSPSTPVNATVPRTWITPSSPSGSNNSGKLPQTGTLLWLVPVLLVIGGAIFGAGVIMKKKAEND